MVNTPQVMNSKLKSMKALWLRCFPEDDEEFVHLFYSYYGHPAHYDTIAKGKEVVAMLHHINSYRYRFFGKTHRCSYIYAACTAPAYRGKGLMGELILRTLNTLQQKGIPLCVTIPATQNLFLFYERFGFVPAFRRTRKKWEERIKPKQELEQRELDFEMPTDFLVSWMTKRLNRRASGVMKHTSRDMQFVVESNLLSGGFHVGLVHGDDSRLEAAAIVEKSDSKLLVREYAGQSYSAVLNLFSLLHDAIPLPIFEESLGAGNESDFFGAARIVNLPVLLQAPGRLPDQLADDSFYIKDNLLPANNGLYHIENQRCTFQPCTPPNAAESTLKVYDIAEYSRKLFAIEPGYMSSMMD